MQFGMTNFPSVVVDNFFTDPDKIVQRAEKLKFNPAENGKYAGVRTEALHEVDPVLHDYCNNKFFRLFYDYNVTDVNWQVSSFFHKIEAPDITDKESWYNKSWIHIDPRAMAAGIIYLTPDAHPDSGTSIYKLKSGEEAIFDETARINFHKNNDRNGYIEKLKEHNNKFEESVIIKNVYNRLAAYDAKEFHAANTYYTGGSVRLTYVFFIYGLQTTSKSPLERLHTMPLIDNWSI